MRIIDYSVLQKRQQRRASQRRRVRRGFLALAAAVLLAGYGYTAYQRPLPLTAAAVIELEPPTDQAPQLVWPQFGQAAIGNEKYGVLATNGAQTPTPTASTAKIMTALAVLKKMPLAKGQPIPIITIEAVDVAAYEYYAANDGSNVRVELGEQITQYQALQALLLPSANNMAETLARWAFGSLDAYNTYANSLAKALGMANTNIADASGFSPDTVSTAHDLTLLGIAAMKEPILAEIIGQSAANIPVAGAIRNTNLLLGKGGIIGMKTGNTDQAGGCFLFAGRHGYDNGRQLIVVGAIMAAPNLTAAMEATTPLLTSTYSGFGDIEVAQKDQKVAAFNLPWGAQNQAVTSGDLTIFGWKGEELTSHVNVEPLDASQAAGSQIGTISAGSLINQKTIPVYLKNNSPPPSPAWRLKRLY